MATVLTVFRMLCGGGLLLCLTFSPAFRLLCVLGGISDVLDGWVARSTGTETAFGAKLDTAADAVFLGAALWKVLRALQLPRWLLLWILGIAVLKVSSAVAGWVLRHRLVVQHTVMNKLCGVLLFLTPLGVHRLPARGTVIWCAAVCAAATLAAAEEGYLTCTGREIR